MLTPETLWFVRLTQQVLEAELQSQTKNLPTEQQQQQVFYPENKLG